MKKRRGMKWAALLRFCLLFVCLQVLGVTYAQWTEVLHIEHSITTGALAIQTPREGFRAFLVDSTGAPVEGEETEAGVSLQPSRDGETIFLTVDGGFAAAALTGEGFLKLEVPLQQRADTTVTTVERLEADLSAQADETLPLTPTDPELVVGETVLLTRDLPAGTLDGFALPLTVELYRQVEEGADGPLAAVYLRLTKESRAALAAPMDISDLALAASDVPLLAAMAAGERMELSAQVRVYYTCALPLYVEQGNENSLPLPGEE